MSCNETVTPLDNANGVGPGDTIRITFEAKVLSDYVGPSVDISGISKYACVRSVNALCDIPHVTVEKIEPSYSPNEYIKDGCGTVWRKLETSKRWRKDNGAERELSQIPKPHIRMKLVEA